MFIIQDNFLDDRLNQELLDEYPIPGPGGFKYMDQLLESERKILDHAANFFDLSDIVGSEIWPNVNETSPDWHIDKDELHFERTGEVKFPHCTLIYYPLVDDNLEGGRLFITDNVIVRPKSRQLIMMMPNMFHIVEPFSNGRRVSVVSCPYNYNPLI